jgi:hypothetical protein
VCPIRVRRKSDVVCVHDGAYLRMFKLVKGKRFSHPTLMLARGMLQSSC